MSNFICRYCHYFSTRCIVFGLLIVGAGVQLPACSAIRPDREDLKVSNTIRISAVVSSDLRFCQTIANQWWSVFNDPLLSSFICRVEQNAQDPKVILARLTEARAILRNGRFGFSPTVAPGPIVRGERINSELPQATAKQAASTMLADASWEIDLLDRLLGSNDIAADGQATFEDYRNIMITVRAEVASVYLRIRTQQAQLNNAANNITLLQSFEELTTRQYENGLTSYFDVAHATHVLALATAEVPAIHGELEQSITSLGILLGESSEALQKDLDLVRLISLQPPTLEVDIPEDRLRQRPDIRTAEQKLTTRIARDYNATDEGYPSLSLTGKIETSPPDTEGNLDLDSPIPEFGSLFSWDIFNLDRNREHIKGNDDRTEQALSSYQRSLQKARKEVTDRLSGYHEQKLQLKILDQSVQALKENFALSTQKYTDGLTNFQNLLDAQQSLFAAENDLAVARGKMTLQLVGLYKALAGGWGNDDRADKHNNTVNRKIVESFAPFTLDGKRESGV